MGRKGVIMASFCISEKSLSPTGRRMTAIKGPRVKGLKLAEFKLFWRKGEALQS